MKKSAVSIIVLWSALAPTLAAGLDIQAIQGPSDAPEQFRKFALKGDLLVSDAKFAALIAGSSRPLVNDLNIPLADPFGQIMAFAPAGRGGRVLTLIGAPSLRIAGKSMTTTVSSVKAEGRGIVVRASALSPSGAKFEITTGYRFDFETGRIGIVSEIRNAGPGDAQSVSYGLGANFLQNYNFTPYNAKAFPELNFRVYQRPEHVLAWWNPNPPETSDKPLPGRLGAGRSHRVTYALLAGTDIAGMLDELYKTAGVPAARQTMDFRPVGSTTAAPRRLPSLPGPVEVLVREPATGAIFYRAFLDKPEAISIPLPEGTYTVRANFFPLTRERTFRLGPSNDRTAREPWLIDIPELGKMKVRVRDGRGAPLFGKVSFIGLAPSESPYFAPENPILTGRGWETSKNSVSPGKDGLDLSLPAGTYMAVASRGPEFGRETRVIEVLAGQNPDLNFIVERAVETPGLISLDTHMHTIHSDGALTVSGRLKGLAAEGVDVAVAADHNFVTDYGPESERLGLGGELAVIAGNEVTARSGSIHFNSFPVTPRAGEAGFGAIGIADDAPSVLFKLAREKNPGSLVQVNHPRSSGLGYFLTYKLDPEKAASANAPFDLNFDVMEAMNGARRSASNQAAILDWFHFLNRGYPIRVVGSSDAHGQDGGETGYSRTYVLYKGPEGKGLNQAALIKAVKDGRSFVSNGPIVAALANGRSTFGDTLTARGGKVNLDVTVTGAPWLEVSEIRLIVNGERRETIPAGKRGEAGVGRLKFEGRIKLTLERDAWIVVEVIGRTSIFPVVQQRSGDGRPEKAALPYALSNPIFVDTNGDGRIDPVWPEKVAIK
jgi:hypothetical protein